ncbi:MAG: T9SS type A sorting domain-containing protein [bacterium]
MKYLSVVFLAVLAISATAAAQGGGITVNVLEGEWDDEGTMKLWPDQQAVFAMHYYAGDGGNVQGMTNGFLFSGQVGDLVVSPTAEGNICSYYKLVCSMRIDPSNPLLVTGSFSIMGKDQGISGGYDEDVFTATTDPLVEGDVVCIDSSYYPPSGTWLWAGPGGGVPSWGGPYCWEVTAPPCCDPEIVDCPGIYTGSHCQTASFIVEAIDFEGDPLTFSLTGPGTLVDHGNGTATYSYTPSLADVGAPITPSVEVCDLFGCGAPCEWTMNFTNEAPVCAFDPGPYAIGSGNTFTKTLTGNAVDCDPYSFQIVGVTPTPVGSYGIVGDQFVFNTDVTDGSYTFNFDIEITDGSAASSCHLMVDILCCGTMEVQIEKTHNAIQGMHELVDVSMIEGAELVKGFDFLIAYDASALSFQSAIEGDVYTECGWEYFTYRFGPDGNCGSGCPSGLLRVVGIAETNNGPNHPDCFTPTLPATLFTLDFLVTDDRTFECMYAPIRFFWMDCGDNSLAYSDVVDPMTVHQGVSRFVIDYDLVGHIEDMTTGFPTYTGVQTECLEGGGPDKPAPVQYVDFLNGGIDIICADSIDDRGDINLNGIANEIADAVLFSNYFVYGLGVFNENLEGQVAASDVNADGLTLSVADLVYLIRIITGDAPPYPKVTPVTAQAFVTAGMMSIDVPMGAAHVVVGGNINPTLLATNMDMQYAYDARQDQTRILVYSLEKDQGFEGEFLGGISGDVIAFEMATYEGAPVMAKLVPSSYWLAQNYPNPFNPSTQIAFRAPGSYKLTIFNIQGQVVREFSGTSESARQEIVQWQADGQASGVYYYRLKADDFSETRKMLLLK